MRPKRRRSWATRCGLKCSRRQGERDAIRAQLGAGDRTVILSFGGSLGARRVNEVVADLCAWEQKEHKPVLHIHATGQYGVELFQNLEKEKGFAPGESLVVKEYINNMPELLAAADLVISRAGALTLAELEGCRAVPLCLSPAPTWQRTISITTPWSCRRPALLWSLRKKT